MARSRFTAGDEPTLARWMRIGAATALIAIAFQSLMEFSLQMPGNAALFAVVAAIAIHAGAPSRSGGITDRRGHAQMTHESRQTEHAPSIPDDVVSRELDGELVVTSLSMGGFLRLDDVGRKIWTLLEQGQGLDSIVPH